MTLTVAIIQSNYIPWKGYFDLMKSADIFVLYDDVQYTKRDWRNRNQIKTPQGLHWLTIPVQVKNRYLQKIEEVEIAEPDWHLQHWACIQSNYRSAPHFEDIAPRLSDLYAQCAGILRLSHINQLLLRGVADLLGIHTPLVKSSQFGHQPGRTENLLHLCQALGATTYLSGPAARDYLDESLFHRAGIDVRYFDYAGYPPYPQLHGPFHHHVSAIDLLMNTGHEAARSYLERTPSVKP